MIPTNPETSLERDGSKFESNPQAPVEDSLSSRRKKIISKRDVSVNLDNFGVIRDLALRRFRGYKRRSSGNVFL